MVEYTIGVSTGDDRIMSVDTWRKGYDEKDDPMIREALRDYMQNHYKDNGEYRQTIILFVGGYKVTALKKQDSPVIILNVCKTE